MIKNFITNLRKTDKDFTDFFENFAFDEVINQIENSKNKINSKIQAISILSTLLGSQSLESFNTILPEILNKELSPIEIKEIIYHSIAYLGISRVYPFIIATNSILKEKNVTLPLEKQSDTNSNNRLEKGIQAQVDIFGPQMKEFYKSGAEDSKHINLWLAQNCFGDYYTRKTLDYKQREIITFCCISAQGGCEPQLTAHALANMNVGNNRIFLISIISLLIPYIGYPRSLNALNCLNNASKTFEEKKGN